MPAYTTQDLRQKLVGVLNGLESGSVEPSIAREMVKVSNAIIETAKVELEFAKTQAIFNRQGDKVTTGPLLLTGEAEDKVIEPEPEPLPKATTTTLEAVKTTDKWNVTDSDHEVIMQQYDKDLPATEIAKATGFDLGMVVQVIDDHESESEPESPELPDIDLVVSYYDDDMRPSDIAKAVGSDVKTITKMINLHKTTNGVAS